MGLGFRLFQPETHILEYLLQPVTSIQLVNVPQTIENVDEREANALEIDLLVEENNRIHPLEIKKSASPDYREVKKFAVLDKAGATRDCGGIVCMSEEAVPLDALNCLIPCSLL